MYFLSKCRVGEKAEPSKKLYFFRTSILRIDDVNDVISEAPAKLANSILLFVKGLGWLTSVNLPNVERRSVPSKDIYSLYRHLCHPLKLSCSQICIFIIHCLRFVMAHY
jgi:hypothetical protein